MKCLYCEDDRLILVKDSTYPYNRVDMKKHITLEHIDKFECLNCGKPSFKEYRLNNKNEKIEQWYKQGLYKLKPDML